MTTQRETQTKPGLPPEAGSPEAFQGENLDDFMEMIATGIDHSSAHSNDHSSRPPAL